MNKINRKYILLLIIAGLLGLSWLFFWLIYSKPMNQPFVVPSSIPTTVESQPMIAPSPKIQNSIEPLKFKSTPFNNKKPVTLEKVEIKQMKATENSKTWINNQVKQIKSRTDNIDEKVLRTSLTAYVNARKKGFDHKQLLTVIDYSKPSSQRRLWVFDLKQNRTLFNTWVTHGKNSGGATATSFSNSPGSLKSSIGVFLTADTYIGGKGLALHLKGLERGVNDNAYSRSVVMHGAWYANPDIIRSNGQLGRSWGCPAVGSNLARPLINTIKENTLLVAYFPDRRWLSHSPFLAG